jgi:serine O-acetyltransferase
MVQNKGLFKSDIEKYYRIHFGTTSPSLFSKIKFWIGNFGLHCVAVYRLGQFSIRLTAKNRIAGYPIRIISWIMDYMAQLIHHVDISNAEIGPGFYIGHAGNILIGPITIGENFSVTHNVTIGVGHSRGMEGIPAIGNNVWIGTGAVISGAIAIGNDVTIANGCMLSRNVPDGSLVAGNPGRVAIRNYDNTKLMGEPD